MLSFSTGMRTLNVRLIGTSPILLHRISRHQEREQIAFHGGGEQSLEEVARNVMSKDTEGNPVVPVCWLWDAIRIGCSRVKIDKQQFSFVKLQSLLFLPDGILSLRSSKGIPPELTVYRSLQHAEPGSKKSIVVIAPKFE